MNYRLTTAYFTWNINALATLKETSIGSVRFFWKLWQIFSPYLCRKKRAFSHEIWKHWIWGETNTPYSSCPHCTTINKTNTLLLLLKICTSSTFLLNIIRKSKMIIYFYKKSKAIFKICLLRPILVWPFTLPGINHDQEECVKSECSTETQFSNLKSWIFVQLCNRKSWKSSVCLSIVWKLSLSKLPQQGPQLTGAEIRYITILLLFLWHKTHIFFIFLMKRRTNACVKSEQHAPPSSSS